MNLKTVFLSRSNRFFTAALAAVLGLGLSLPASGQSAAPAAEKHLAAQVGMPVNGGAATTATDYSPAALASPNWAGLMSAGQGSGTHEGLKMHGHWVIDVKNPDGTVVAHRDFENALESSAQGYLIGLLSGYQVPGDYMIVLGPASGASPCNATFQFCGLVHNLNTFPALGYCGVYYCTGSSLNYTYNFGTGYAGPFSMVLSGSITANQTGTVGTVYSIISTCANIGFSTTTNPSSIETNSPAFCVTQTSPEPWYGPLSSASITPVAVASGQIIQVTVTITFS